MKTLMLALLVVAAAAGAAAEDFSPHWNGVWTAEGTIFSVQVAVADGAVELRQLESLGFEWTSGTGTATGAVLEIEVDYAGVSGVIEARLQDTVTAIVFARSCRPDFMVVCVLAKNRQAIFRKTEAAAR